MKEYVFYTHEGFTQSPTNIDVENLQILGFANGENYKIALNELLRQNPWILEYGFDPFRIKAVEVLYDN